MSYEEQLTIFDFLERKKGKSVRRIEAQQAKPFILGIHYARRMPCIQYAFGLYEDGDLIGVVTYGQPASPTVCSGIAGVENKGDVLELNRLVMLPWKNGKNNASYLVSHSLKMLPNHTYVISYADWGGWHHVGYVYQATNFLYTGITKERTDPYTEGSHPRHYDPNETRRQIRTAKHRYVYMVGNKREKKQMMKEFRWKIVPKYPKGQSRRHDTNEPGKGNTC